MSRFTYFLSGSLLGIVGTLAYVRHYHLHYSPYLLSHEHRPKFREETSVVSRPPNFVSDIQKTLSTPAYNSEDAEEVPAKPSTLSRLKEEVVELEGKAVSKGKEVAHKLQEKIKEGIHAVEDKLSEPVEKVEQFRNVTVERAAQMQELAEEKLRKMERNAQKAKDTVAQVTADGLQNLRDAVKGIDKSTNSNQGQVPATKPLVTQSIQTEEPKPHAHIHHSHRHHRDRGSQYFKLTPEKADQLAKRIQRNTEGSLGRDAREESGDGTVGYTKLHPPKYKEEIVREKR